MVVEVDALWHISNLYRHAAMSYEREARPTRVRITAGRRSPTLCSAPLAAAATPHRSLPDEVPMLVGHAPVPQYDPAEVAHDCAIAQRETDERECA